VIFILLVQNISAVGPSPIQWVAEVLSSELRQTDRETDHASPARDVKNPKTNFHSSSSCTVFA
jgi:hypothetical protein